MIDPSVYLFQSDLFRSLAPGHRARLAAICVPHTLKRHEYLFHEGDRAMAFYFCAKGSVRLYKTGEDGQEVVIKIIGPGEFFAEAILFAARRYPVSAEALTDSLLFLIPKAQFECLLEDHRFRNDFLAVLMDKLHYLTDRIRDLSVFEVETRLLRFLEAQSGGRQIFRLPLSKKDVASAIGTTPETLSRILGRLHQEGRILWKGRWVNFLTRESPGKTEKRGRQTGPKGA